MRSDVRTHARPDPARTASARAMHADGMHACCLNDRHARSRRHGTERVRHA
jgi:hypothetical protein